MGQVVNLRPIGNRPPQGRRVANPPRKPKRGPPKRAALFLSDPLFAKTGCGKDSSCPPPAQIRACAANAYGSYLEYLAQTAPSEMGAGFLAQADSGQSESGSAPTSTGCADCAAATLIASSALRSFAATSRSFAVMRFPTLLRFTVSFPLLWIVLQICVNPRKLNVSGFPAPSRFRNRPNSIRRVFSACNSNPNSAIRSRNRVGKLSASSRYWNPGTWRVAPGNLTPRLSQNRT